jgi:enoyl-CoA hydratase/carnithine racemase
MFLTAAEIGAAEALAWGLLDVVTDDAQARAHALATTLASGAPLAMAGLRRTVRAIARAPIDPAERAELETLRAEAFASEDAVEARTAMREKRPPRWKGR